MIYLAKQKFNIFCWVLNPGLLVYLFANSYTRILFVHVSDFILIFILSPTKSDSSFSIN